MNILSRHSPWRRLSLLETLGTMRLGALMVTGIIICFPPVQANAADWGPWEASGANQQRADRPEVNLFDQAIRNFQKYISPLDGPRCPMYPTCSAYARQALHRHGPLLGVFMTADRLIHEGDPLEQQESIIKWGYRRYLDPLENNDFWLTTN